MTDALERLNAALADRYAIERELGAGGMATVYLAEDLRHHRQVALKVLKPEIAATLGAGRFAREIEVAARLQHPNILPLLDSGEAAGFFFYVMPYVEGESLRDRLARGGELPIPDAVRILMEVADALSEAHAHGVVHRDIKPDNVMLRGRHALVTDFGVAKAVTAATGYALLTSTGVALGTPTYMAPEQATADPHQDHRVDIYALGVLAYELLTGRAPYSATTAQEMLAAHITAEPEPLEKYRPAVPPALAAVVLKCLAKKPADRWQSAEELLQHLEPLATPSGGTTPTQTAPVRPRSPRSRAAAVARWAVAVIAVGAGAWVVWRWLRPAEPVWELTNIRQVTHDPELDLFPAISPDGREVAYASGYGRDLHVYVRDVEGGRSLPLTTDHSGTQMPTAWLEDGSRVLVAARNTSLPSTTTAYVVPRLGGPPQTALSAQAWGLRGDTALYQRGDSLFIGGAAGGWERLLAVARGLHSAAWSPDGSRVAFVQNNYQYILPNNWGNPVPSSVWTIGVRGGAPVAATDSGSRAFHESPAWLPDGRHLLLVSDRDGPRDLYMLAVEANGRPGELHRLTTGLEAHTASVSADGRTVAYSRLIIRRNVYSLAVPASGVTSVRAAVPVTTGNQAIEDVDRSPDGRWLAFDSNLDGRTHIYMMATGGGEPRRITGGAWDDWSPSFSPDGREIAYYSPRFGTRDLFLIRADGTGETRLTSDPGEEYHPKFSPDGLSLAYSGERGGQTFLFLVHRDSIGGTWGAPEQLTHGGADFHGRWHPDGRRLVYKSALGVSVVTVGGAERLVLDYGREGLVPLMYPFWSPDGRAIRFGAAARDGQAGIWEMPSAGGRLRLIVRFDDPARAVNSYGFAPGAPAMYLVIAGFESDVYVAGLERR